MSRVRAYRGPGGGTGPRGRRGCESEGGVGIRGGGPPQAPPEASPPQAKKIFDISRPRGSNSAACGRTRKRRERRLWARRSSGRRRSWRSSSRLRSRSFLSCALRQSSATTRRSSRVACSAPRPRPTFGGRLRDGEPCGQRTTVRRRTSVHDIKLIERELLEARGQPEERASARDGAETRCARMEPNVGRNDAFSRMYLAATSTCHHHHHMCRYQRGGANQPVPLSQPPDAALSRRAVRNISAAQKMWIDAIVKTRQHPPTAVRSECASAWRR